MVYRYVSKSKWVSLKGTRPVKTPLLVIIYKSEKLKTPSYQGLLFLDLTVFSILASYFDVCYSIEKVIGAI